MCEHSPGDMLFADLLRDPLTRQVMRSDGVTQREMILLGKRVLSALAARDPDHSDQGNARAFQVQRDRTTAIAHGVQQ